MKALIYKELKLALHPICYFFVLFFPILFLIPSYPIGVCFIYVLTCYPILFLGANKGEQSNDLLYSTLLPVRKKDIVLARIFTVLLIQTAFIVLASILYPAARVINDLAISEAKDQKRVTPGLGLDSFVLLIAIIIIGYALSDLIFFPIYYKNGKSIVMSTLFTIIGFVIYVGLFTIGLPYVPGLEGVNSMHIGIQFVILAISLLVSFGLHFIVYKVSSKNLEKVDF